VFPVILSGSNLFGFGALLYIRALGSQSAGCQYISPNNCANLLVFRGVIVQF